jgi:hypothetical protein
MNAPLSPIAEKTSCAQIQPLYRDWMLFQLLIT